MLLPLPLLLLPPLFSPSLPDPLRKSGAENKLEEGRRSTGCAAAVAADPSIGGAASKPGGGDMLPIEPARDARRRGVGGDADGELSSFDPRRSAAPSSAWHSPGNARCNARMTWSLISSSPGANFSNQARARSGLAGDEKLAHRRRPTSCTGLA